MTETNKNFLRRITDKIFGGINLTWPKLILSAVAAGVLTAVIAIIPIFQNTSFITITVTFEVWILFGIIIIMNSKSNLDSALKCFVFFLISQPLVYLIQVPFSWQGWNLFGYYKYWFIWTLICFPMGFIGYWMKKDKWWGYLILLPMIALTAVIVLTVICLLNPPIYSTEIMGNGEEYKFDDSYAVYLTDEEYGDVEIKYDDALENYMIHADFKRAGDTVLTLVSPDGVKEEYDLHIERQTYEITRRVSEG